MGAIVTSFDYATWIARYPEFSEVAEATAELYWAEAQMYHDNTGSGPVPTVAQQTILLNMVTAHIAARYATPAGGAQASNTPVGRIASATEGSVSVSLQNDYPPGSAQWFQQTKYGADYWSATRQYRTARYRVGPQRFFNPLYPNLPGTGIP